MGLVSTFLGQSAFSMEFDTPAPELPSHSDYVLGADHQPKVLISRPASSTICA